MVKFVNQGWLSCYSKGYLQSLPGCECVFEKKSEWNIEQKTSSAVCRRLSVIRQLHGSRSWKANLTPAMYVFISLFHSQKHILTIRRKETPNKHYSSIQLMTQENQIENETTYSEATRFMFNHLINFSSYIHRYKLNVVAINIYIYYFGLYIFIYFSSWQTKAIKSHDQLTHTEMWCHPIGYNHMQTLLGSAFLIWVCQYFYMHS